MIITRAPARISFMGGGTDIAAFYNHFPGRVISTAIDKFVYVTVNRSILARGVSARYSNSELVGHPRELKNDRIREALLHAGITSNIDVGFFSGIPTKAGLGSSSSFSVALMKAIYLLENKKIDKLENAELASHLEIDLVKDPIGKQDQYASAFGGFNIFEFNSDNSVNVIPVRLDFKLKSDFKDHLLLFFTGISREAKSVLLEQVSNTKINFEVLKKMSDSVFPFRDKLLAGDFEGLGKMLHESWLLKKSLASNVSNSIVDDFYETGLKAGAWGGKILGAGGGGCLLFIAPPEAQKDIKSALIRVAQTHNLTDFIGIDFNFIQSGAETLMNQF